MPKSIFFPLRLIFFFLTLLLVAGLVAGCAMNIGGGGGSDTPPYDPPDDPTPPPAGSVSPLATLLANDSARTSATELSFWLTSPTNEVLYRAKLHGDDSGQLPPVPVAYEIGARRTADACTFEEGVYQLHWQAPGEAEQTHDYHVSNLWRRVYASTLAGQLRNLFHTADGVLGCRFENLPVDRTVDLYLVADRDDWQENDALVDLRGAPHEVLTGTGNLTVQLWTSPIPGRYDVIVDMNRNASFDTGDLIDGASGPGFIVVGSRLGGSEQLATDSQGLPQQAFATGDTVYTACYPDEQLPLAGTSPWVTIYCCAHRDEWPDGAALTDAGAGAEVVPLQPDTRALVPTPIAGSDLADGTYDVVYDLDSDGIFNSGVDVVDNTDASGAASGGFRMGEAPPPGPEIPVPPVDSADLLIGLTWTGDTNLDVNLVSPTGKWCNVWLANPGEGMHHLGDVSLAGDTEWLSVDAGAVVAGTYGAMVTRHTGDGGSASVYLDIWVNLGTASEQHYRLLHELSTADISWKATGIDWPAGVLVMYPPDY